MKLIYIGEGKFLPGVPARDLTDAEVAAVGLDILLRSGLYRLPAKPDVVGGKENRMRHSGGTENKEDHNG